MRVVLVVNPGARKVTAEATSATVRRWSRDHDLSVVASTPAGLEAALSADLPGAEAVAVLSGDGLLNRVANVLADVRSDVALVPLPGGTTNVVARSLGLPRDLDAANDRALAALADGETARAGWGRLNGRGFLANAGVGLDAAVVARVEAQPARKQRFGHLWFAAAAAREARRGLRTARLVTAEGDGAHRPSTCWVLALARHPYSYAGSRPIEPVPAGAPWGPWGDGLWMLSFGPMGFPRAARLIARMVMTSRGITPDDGVEVWKMCDEITVRSSESVRAQTDGEPMGEASSFTFGWQPDALRLIAPR